MAATGLSGKRKRRRHEEVQPLSGTRYSVRLLAKRCLILEWMPDELLVEILADCPFDVLLVARLVCRKFREQIDVLCRMRAVQMRRPPPRPYFVRQAHWFEFAKWLVANRFSAEREGRVDGYRQLRTYVLRSGMRIKDYQDAPIAKEALIAVPVCRSVGIPYTLPTHVNVFARRDEETKKLHYIPFHSAILRGVAKGHVCCVVQFYRCKSIQPLQSGCWCYEPGHGCLICFSPDSLDDESYFAAEEGLCTCDPEHKWLYGWRGSVWH